MKYFKEGQFQGKIKRLSSNTNIEEEKDRNNLGFEREKVYMNIILRKVKMTTCIFNNDFEKYSH